MMNMFNKLILVTKRTNS